MVEMLSQFLLLAVSTLCLVLFGDFGRQSLREQEPRAAWAGFGLAAAGSLLFGCAAFLPLPYRLSLIGFTAVLLLSAGIAFVWPGKRIARADETPSHRYDERNIPFARARLVPDSPTYQEYYRQHPENLPPDLSFRVQPGLLSPQAAFANPFLFASPQASFFLTAALRDSVDGPVGPEKHALSPAEMSAYIKELALYYGAVEVGITMLQPYHVYSHIGRGTGKWGDAIAVEHRCAIAFTLEMDQSMLSAGPAAPGIMESAKQYVEAARVAVQLAAAIRALGFTARAHIDGNYQVIAPLVARDAGLGEIGRMGLLMTERNGPRIRLGVVTTDMLLAPDLRRASAAVLEFCSFCKKCAACCPSRAVPLGEREEIDGSLRWRIDADRCFHYWCTVGTDCGRCVAVCPFSHPNHWTHNLVRWSIARSHVFRRAAFHLDNLLYGRKPSPHRPPEWIRPVTVRGKQT